MCVWVSLIVPTVLFFVFAGPRLWRITPALPILVAIVGLWTVMMLVVTQCTDPGIIPRSVPGRVVSSVDELHDRYRRNDRGMLHEASSAAPSQLRQQGYAETMAEHKSSPSTSTATGAGGGGSSLPSVHLSRRDQPQQPSSSSFSPSSSSSSSSTTSIHVPASDQAPVASIGGITTRISVHEPSLFRSDRGTLTTAYTELTTTEAVLPAHIHAQVQRHIAQNVAANGTSVGGEDGGRRMSSSSTNSHESSARLLQDGEDDVEDVDVYTGKRADTAGPRRSDGASRPMLTLPDDDNVSHVSHGGDSGSSGSNTTARPRSDSEDRSMKLANAVSHTPATSSSSSSSSPSSASSSSSSSLSAGTRRGRMEDANSSSEAELVVPGSLQASGGVVRSVDHPVPTPRPST